MIVVAPAGLGIVKAVLVDRFGFPSEGSEGGPMGPVGRSTEVVGNGQPFGKGGYRVGSTEMGLA